jgi:hypothetical protein
MEDVIRPVRGEHIIETIAVGDVADQRHHVDMRVLAGNLEVHEVERAFRLLEQQELRGAEARDLARELRADRSRTAGHHDDAAGDVVRHLLEVELHGLAAEEILDLHVPELAGLRATVEQVVDRRQDLEVDPRFPAAIDDAAHLLARGRRHGDDEHLHLIVHRDAEDVGRRTEHRNAMQRAAVRPAVVIEQPDELECRATVVLALADETLAGRTRAQNEGALALARQHREQALAEAAGGESHPPGEEDREQPVEGEYGARHARQLPREEQRRDEQRRADADGGGDAHEVPQAHVLPVPAIQPEAVEHHELDRHQERQRRPEELLVRGRRLEVEPERKGEMIRERNQRQVRQDDERSAVLYDVVRRRDEHSR